MIFDLRKERNRIMDKIEKELQVIREHNIKEEMLSQMI